MVALSNSHIITVNKFADQFDYHPSHVRRMINRGDLPAFKIKLNNGGTGSWRIDLSKLDIEENNTQEIDVFEKQENHFTPDGNIFDMIDKM